MIPPHSDGEQQGGELRKGDPAVDAVPGHGPGSLEVTAGCNFTFTHPPWDREPGFRTPKLGVSRWESREVTCGFPMTGRRKGELSQSLLVLSSQQRGGVLKTMLWEQVEGLAELSWGLRMPRPSPMAPFCWGWNCWVMGR